MEIRAAEFCLITSDAHITNARHKRWSIITQHLLLLLLLLMLSAAAPDLQNAGALLPSREVKRSVLSVCLFVCPFVSTLTYEATGRDACLSIVTTAGRRPKFKFVGQCWMGQIPLKIPMLGHEFAFSTQHADIPARGNTITRSIWPQYSTKDTFYRPTLYSSAIYAVVVCLSVCLCLSHAGIISKNNYTSKKLVCIIN